MEITNPTIRQVESASRIEPNAGALYGTGGFENMTLRMESEELRIRNRIAEDLALSVLEA